MRREDVCTFLVLAAFFTGLVLGVVGAIAVIYDL